MRLRIVGVGLYGKAREALGLACLAQLGANQSQRKQGLGVLRISFERVGVKAFGAGNAALEQVKFRQTKAGVYVVGIFFLDVLENLLGFVKAAQRYQGKAFQI